MAQHRLLITDITDYGTSLHCVAGWDIDRKKMVRPEPAPAAFWPANQVGPGKTFEHAAMVEFNAGPPNPPTHYPHRTEDRVVVGSIRRIEKLPKRERDRILGATISPNLDDVFDENLQVKNLKGYILRGTECRSLGAIEVDAATFQIFEEASLEGKKKLRCFVRHKTGVIHPTLPSTRIRALWKEEGINSVKAKFRSASRLHLRIGLARAFPEDRCYVQVNDLYIIE